MSNKSDEKQGGTKEIGDDAASMHQEDGTSAASDDATMTPDGVHDDDDAGDAVTVKDDDATDEQATQTPEERQEEQTATTEETEKDDDATPTADETDADADADGNDDTNDTPSTDDEDESDTDASPSNADDASPDANDTVTDTSDTASDEDDAERQDDETAATQDVPPTEGDDANRHDDEDSDGKQDATEDVSDADGSADDGDKTGNADTKANDASADAETGNADAESEAADVAAKSDVDTETSDANVDAEKDNVVTDSGDSTTQQDESEQHDDATTETPATPQKADDDADESAKDRDGTERRHVGKKKVVAIACGVAVAAIAAGCLYVGHETSVALSQASSAITQAKDTDSSMRGVLERTKSFSNLTDDNVMPDDGGKDGILPAYAKARKAASSIVTKKMPSIDGISWYELNDSRAVRDDAKAMAGKKRNALRTLRASVAKVTMSRHKRECTDAKNALKAASESAKKVLDGTEGQVHDNAIRQTLADAIGNGNKLLGKKDLLSASVYSSAQEQIDAASKAVSDDHAKWQKEKEASEAAERARKAAAARKTYASRSAAAAAASSSGGQPVQSSDGTWYVTYRGNDVEGTANADGSVSEYCDGYFVAHRGTKNGNMIASKPRRVMVDGKSYHYVSSTIVDDDTDLDYALSYLRQNGGIGFQTCTIPSGRDILVHYEPDN